jgi:hypothetical protein
MQAFLFGRVTPGKCGTPPCKSGQLEKELGLEVSSATHAARLIIFEIMILTSPLNSPLPDPTHAVWDRVRYFRDLT